MPNPTYLRQNRPLLFSPSVVRSIITEDINTSAFERTDFESFSSTALDNSGSFRYNTPGEGIKSTQQLNVDWSIFSNHTFYNSAHVKTNVAFRKIFDQFPFDGTQSEFEIFIDGLTGFEKYVYDQFPKNKNYLFFSGTQPGQIGALSGTYVTVKDVAGAAYPGVSKNTTGNSILNPDLNSMTVEFWSYIPSQSNSASIVLEKLAQPSTGLYHGFAATLATTSSVNLGNIKFTVVSGAYSINASTDFNKGSWNHFAFIWDRSASNNRIFSYVNGISQGYSSQQEIGILNMDSADLLIGSGSAFTGFTPLCTFSGALDELRIWHLNRNQEKRDEFQRKNVFSQENLKLYFKFNEASGSGTPIVLDHSGNSLHGQLCSWAFSNNIREIASGSIAGSSPMTYEKLANNPILFPTHPDIEDLNQDFLDDAVEFDRVNPNRIDRLIPQHYLLQGQYQDGLTTEEGPIVDGLTITGTTPDTAKLGNTQVILMLLYTWAKFFDEMKLYIQAFGNLIHLDYDPIDTVPDAFLQLFAEKFGIRLPPLFTGSNIQQFINAENIDDSISTNDYSLQYIQNQIWRRILLNLQDVLKSKGTIHSIKSFIRSTGIDPDNNFRIREFGGPNIKKLENVRETRGEVSTLINFSGSNGFIKSPFLSGSRTQKESGYPDPSATSIFSNGIDTNVNDGLFTSGSWTYEGIYRFPTTGSLTSITQSLVRIHTTGSGAPVGGFLLANLLVQKNGGINLCISPNSSGSTSLTLPITGADLFDGNLWNVSFGRNRADSINSKISSSYFLRIGKQEFGDIVNYYSTSSYFNENPGSNLIWNNIQSYGNASGSYLVIGSQSLGTTGSFLNNTGSFSSYHRTTNFDGRVGHIRFWSKAISEIEFKEHVRNFKSLGVQDPTTNFNFVTNKTGSWERLRMDVSSDQILSQSDSSGFLKLIDFSQNNLDWTGSFNITSSVILPQRFQYSLLSPKFDVGSTTDKVRIRSFNSYDNVLSNSYSQVAPIYAIEPSERPQDNTRFTIDFSIVDALDQDIINLFSTFDSLDNIIGNPELVFSPDYPKLDVLRNIYFNRLTTTMNLKSFFEFYKWFDTNIGVFISQLIPRKTKFLGVNFVIESHMLERAKIEYQYSDQYLGDSSRQSLNRDLLFQQIAGVIARY